jgi:hypothetical protein
MEKISKCKFLLAAFVMFYACNSIEPKQQSNSLLSFVDTSLFQIDTLMTHVQVDSQELSIALLRDKLDEHQHPFDTNLVRPVTLAVYSDSTNHLLYLKSFETEPDDYPYTSPNIFKANEANLKERGPLFFSLEKGYGGSGSSYQLFWVRYLDKTVHLVPLFKGTGELSYPYFLNNGNQIILFEAIWDMNQGESHYSAHRIQLTSISLENEQPIQQILGKTTSKYLLPDNEIAAKALIEQFKLHEPKFSELKHF